MNVFGKGAATLSDRPWAVGDLESLAADDARDGAADVYHDRQRARDEAHLRARRWELLAEHWQRVASGLLCEPLSPGSTLPGWEECGSTGVPSWAVARAVVYARCAARVSEWARQARERSR